MRFVGGSGSGGGSILAMNIAATVERLINRANDFEAKIKSLEQKQRELELKLESKEGK